MFRLKHFVILTEKGSFKKWQTKSFKSLDVRGHVLNISFSLLYRYKWVTLEKSGRVIQSRKVKYRWLEKSDVWRHKLLLNNHWYSSYKYIWIGMIEQSCMMYHDPNLNCYIRVHYIQMHKGQINFYSYAFIIIELGLGLGLRWTIFINYYSFIIDLLRIITKPRFGLLENIFY